MQQPANCEGIKMVKKYIFVNDRGYRIGECHHNAKLSDHDVDLMLKMRDEGDTYANLAKWFEVSRSCIADICKGRRRHSIMRIAISVRNSENT
jgi:Mor family transcriptional regulator